METRQIDELTNQGPGAQTPVPGTSSQLVERFRALVDRWRAERGHYSSIEKLCMHDAYQQIIGMRQPAVPLILAEFEARLGHWDWALRAITGENPVPKASQGKLKEMAAAWTDWARRKGYHW